MDVSFSRNQVYSAFLTGIYSDKTLGSRLWIEIIDYKQMIAFHRGKKILRRRRTLKKILISVN